MDDNYIAQQLLRLQAIKRCAWKNRDRIIARLAIEMEMELLSLTPDIHEDDIDATSLNNPNYPDESE